jgi:hypothetical protein
MNTDDECRGSERTGNEIDAGQSDEGEAMVRSEWRDEGVG